MSVRAKIIAITPFLCVIAYLLIGYISGVWFPTLSIFLAIPFVSILFNKPLKYIYPLLCIIIYIVLGFVWCWHPTWIIFLTIPIYFILIS